MSMDLDKYNLSEEEKKLTEKALGEIFSGGDSELATSLWYADYKEVPVSIKTFLSDPHYLGQSTGNGELVYRYILDELSHVFSPKGTDIMEVCLTGDTQVKLLDGTTASMEDLYKRQFDGEGKFYVYSFNEDTDAVTVGVAHTIIHNGVKPVYRVTLDNGESFKSTDDHKFLMRDKSWKRVRDLKAGESFMPIVDSVYQYKVVSVEFVGYEEVYDMQVDDCHNFGLYCGVYASNCVTGAIGIGKTSLAIWGLCYLLYRLMCLRDMRTYYRLAGGNVGVAFFNVTLEKSYGVAYNRMQECLKNSPWFLERGHLLGKKHIHYKPDAPIDFVVGSLESHGLGENIYCITGDTNIVTKKGIYPIHSLSNQHVTVLTYNTVTGGMEWSSMAYVIDRGKKDDIYEIELEDGSVFKCTGDHSILVEDANGEQYYKQAQDLVPDDEIVEGSIA